jgi:hypothetical protein
MASRTRLAAESETEAREQPLLQPDQKMGSTDDRLVLDKNTGRLYFFVVNRVTDFPFSTTLVELQLLLFTSYHRS